MSLAQSNGRTVHSMKWDPGTFAPAEVLVSRPNSLRLTRIWKVRSHCCTALLLFRLPLRLVWYGVLGMDGRCPASG